METLEQFIQSNPDPRELKRALAVQMSQRGRSCSRCSDKLTLAKIDKTSKEIDHLLIMG